MLYLYGFLLRIWDHSLGRKEASTLRSVSLTTIHFYSKLLWAPLNETYVYCICFLHHPLLARTVSCLHKEKVHPISDLLCCSGDVSFGSAGSCLQAQALLKLCNCFCLQAILEWLLPLEFIVNHLFSVSHLDLLHAFICFRVWCDWTCTFSKSEHQDERPFGFLSRV